MASLIDSLIEVLENISKEYENLLGLSMKKTPVIVAGDLNQLAVITDEEQLTVSKINKFDTQMQKTLKEIADVINTDVSELDLMVIIGFMGPKPEEQQKLAVIHDKLKSLVMQVARINDQNGELIKDALEMVQFEMNILQASKGAPETANYDRTAYNDGSVIGVAAKGFDARQ
ncbi:MAG: flagellar protein FlgN [Lachnospiraceae bacterium]|nr:flagellar protein FlgN [Lachnospiraceae bacterium]